MSLGTLLLVLVLCLQLILFAIVMSGILQLHEKVDYLVKKLAPKPKEKDPWA